MDIIGQISQLFIFQDLSQADLVRIKNCSSIFETKGGQVLFQEGEPAQSFFAIVSGSLKVYKASPDGNEQILHIQYPGDFIAEATLFDTGLYPANCSTLSTCQLIRINSEEFRKLLQGSPSLCFKIMSAYSKRLRQMTKLVGSLSLQDIKSRLADYLLSNANWQVQPGVCQLSISKKELAALLGTIPETLSRTLKFFQKKGLIRLENYGKTIWLEQPSDLKNRFY